MSLLEQNYVIILSHEENFSRTVASQVIEKPAVSAWMIFFPFIFIHYFLNLKRFKAGVEEFTKQFLHNKKIALDAAMNSLKFREEKNKAIEMGLSKIYKYENSEKFKLLKQKQLREVEILFDHYEKLLKTKGENFENLIKRVYLTEFSYRQFLTKLQKAEREVYEEVLNLSDINQEFIMIISKIESTVEKLREQEIRTIF